MSSQNRVEIIYDMIANLQPGNLNQGVKKINDLLKGIKLSDKMTVEYKESMAEIEKGLKNFQTSVNLPLTDDKSLKNALKDYKALEKALAKMQTLLNKIGLDAKDFQWLPDHKDFEKFQLAEQVGAELEKVEGKLEKAFGNFKTRFRSNFQKTGELGLDFNMSELIEAATVPGGRMPYSLSRGEYAAEATILKEIAATKERLVGFSDKLVENEKKLQELKESSDASERQEEIEKTEKTIERLERSIEIREEEIASFNNDIEVIKNLREAYESLKKIANLSKEELAEYAEEGEGVYDILQKLVNEALKTFSQTMEEAGEATKETRKTLEGFEEPLKDIEKHNDEIKRGEQELANFQRRLLDFFSVSNGWNLVRKVISNAFKVVKELDAAMTDIAVVTEMTLDQVWTGRETYSKTAQELGAATLDVVKASTLYYQQGLSEAEVNEVTTETIKMGRIARIDGARATDLMTSAVRGFNLEMKDSIMINDTYSQIAAKSAANVEELANAMTKTAAIAHSAGADFQNMTAFLAQMIETTREPSESLGTAMKTIVARFQEMKKAPDEIGEIDGETVDANALEKALRSVGIALRDANGEFRKFDDVIFEISANWASMDKMSQRYIATTAAGSRQQSRFIALVQNHERLMELTGYATDNAGASNEQFEKTLDSLEAKMNKMKNALDLLWTTLMNSDLIKIVIDLVTKLVEIINKLTQSFGSFGGSIVGIGLALTSFKVGGTVLEKILGSVGQALGVGDKKAKGFGQTLLGLAQNMKSPKEALSSFGTSIGSFLKNLKEGRLGVTKTVDTFKILEDGTQTLVNSTTTHGKSIKELFSGLTKYANLGKFALIAAAITGIAIAIERVIVTDKERLALLEESSKRQQELIDTTSQQIEELKSGLDGLRTSEETLNSLTRGTTEWKEALIKTNNEVLNLINTFPKLALYVEKTKFGSLTISEEGVQKILENQEAFLQKQQLAHLGSQMQILELDLKIDTKTFSGLEKEIANLTGISTEKIREIAADFQILGGSISALGQEENKYSDDLLKKLYDAAGGTESAFNSFQEIIQKSGDNFLKLGEIVKTVKNDLEGIGTTFTTLMIQNDTDLASLMEDKVTQPIVEAILASYNPKHYGSKVQIRKEQLEKGIDPEKEEYIPGVIETRGLSGGAYVEAAKHNKKIIEDHTINLFADIMGDTTSEEIRKQMKSKEDPLTFEEILEVVASDQIKIEMVEAAKKHATDMQEYINENPALGIALTNALRAGGSFLTSDEIELLENTFTETTVASLAGRKGLFKTLGLDEELLLKNIEEQKLNQLAIDQKYREKLNKENDELALTQYDELVKGMGMKSKDALASLLQDLQVQFGEESAKKVLGTFSEAFEGLDVREVEKALAEIFSIDLTDINQIESLKNKFEELGIVLDENQFEKLKKQLIESYYAIQKISKEDLAEKITGINKILNEIGTLDKTKISEEQYQDLIEADSSLIGDFATNLDGSYTYLGNGMETLTNALLTYSKKLIEAQKDQLEAKIDAGELINELRSEGGLYENVKFEDYAKFIKEFVTKAGNLGIDVTQLGLGLSSNVDNFLEGKDFQEIQTIFTELNFLAGAIKENEENINELIQSEALQKAFTSTPSELSTLAIEASAEGNIQELEAYSKALQAQAVAAEVTQDKIENYQKAIKTGDFALIAATGNVLALEIAQKELNKKLEEEQKIIDELIESLEGIGELEPEEQLKNLSYIFNDILDLNISEEFLSASENYELLSQVLRGDQDAWENLLEQTYNVTEAFRDFAATSEFSAEVIDSVINFLDNSSFSITGTADISPLLQNLSLGEAAVRDLVNLINSFEGMSVTAQPQYGWIEDLVSTPSGSGLMKMKTYGVIGYKYVVNNAGFKPARTPFTPSTKSSKSKGGGGGGKGGGGKEELPWENSYDWLYNILQDINKAIRERNILEWKYEKMLQERKYIAQDLLENRRAQRDLLEEELELQKQELQGREAELTGLKKKHSGVSSYVWWDEITQSPKINWELVNENKDPTRGEQIEEALSDFEQVSDQIHDLITGQMQTIDEIQVLQNLGKDDWLDLEDRVLKALIAQYQAEIDELSTINDSINDTNARLLDAVQNSLNKIRQDRENEKTTKSIQDKESRLAYLRQDTSGANAMEILALERELEEDKESYTDTLIDQKITELQEQNDLAAKQRERQIELSQAALDTAVEQGELWDETFQVLSGALGTNGQLSPDFMAWVGRWENTKAMSTVRKEDWEKGLEAQVKSGFSWLTDQAGYDNIKATQDNLKNGLSGMSTIQTNIDKNQKTIGRDIVGAIDRLDMSPVINVNVPPAVSNPPPAAKTTTNTTGSNSTGTPGNPKYVSTPTYTAKNLSQPKDQHQIWQITDNSNSKNKWELAKYQGELRLDGKSLGTSQEAIAALKKKFPNMTWSGGMKAYKEGGLADFTGPAWLDGTKEKPEAVLDSIDTSNLIQLKDILRDILRSSPSKTEYSTKGDSYYDIKIEVDELSNDYDVDRVIEKIKKELAKEGAYRNVNIVNRRMKY